MELSNASALVANLRRGDSGAFNQVYDTYRPRVFGFLARLCGRRDLAEDLLQETFLRLAGKAPDLEPDTKLGAWLFTVARNLFVSHCRHARLDRNLPDSKEPEEPVEWISPFDLASVLETERNLERALAMLSPALREVALLVAQERFEPQEAAQMLGLTAEALRQRLSRARAELAKHLSLFENANQENG